MSHSDNRTITVSDVGFKPLVSKQPDDDFFYLFDYTTWLGTDTTIASATITVNPTTSGPTAGTPSVVGGTKVKVLISGGSAGWRGVITCEATMADTEVKQAEMEMTIREIDYVAPGS